ncbi:Mu transposase C-terminal domain-containing protein [Micromonospora sp. WMMD980]|uniref:Mu transposase C-terminal domain-containing protein n=1 Tax=Micromonospora sp. WMMD980 TaxID=3016088 RepID=UPI002415A889|nr:Mu transposase C-terminal domain-containing protein [Micromonospora sp. WMMD980]MDG4801063.1 Mu transposase C-terminal domain-containing protein [Micromonospora sp. WMMD980]MDG4803210.1 Mu transposase C-terminal domain-containing protein [Micromonospora sp. WMMD980]MDG4803583.1 Mu transposase C-terminal domain-containing protein [Micromonospora sp. WMMD980]MDG4803668.1 Mu transposase C-terminal domain-containing protein [Micromonospora sp. WMMD980]
MVGVAGPAVRLADAMGVVSTVPLAVLQASPGFAVVGAGAPAVVPAAGQLEDVPAAVLEQALWWEQHILEVLHGRRRDGDVGEGPRPEYDPVVQSLARRERAKVAELNAAGCPAAISTVRRYRLRYQAQGLFGLVDQRAARRTPVFGRVDEAVVEAMRAAIAETTDASSRTAGFVLWRTEQLLAARGDAVVVPSQRTLYRLFDKLAAGKHVTGAARTRRSLANRPDGPFGQVTVSAPGELMQIDSTPLDVLVLLDDGVVGRVELTGMIDVATRTVTAAVLRPTTKAVDASVLLARTVTPEPMRPGWVDALRMSRSVLPHQRLLSIDERLEHAAARPVIVPETIVCDHGKVFVSHNFRASCRFLGINFQPAHKATPTDKPHIERMLASVATGFTQFVAGYTGANAERRGRKVEDGPLWSLLELQELLDEWIVAAWQNRPHDGLRDPVSPGRAFTPNEKYAALIEAAGYVPVALSGADYIELLPARWQAINAYGIRINYRTYDAEALNPLRGQPSGVTAKNDRWEIHYDPYDVSRVWVRDPAGGWIRAGWKHLDRVISPFGELAWDHVRKGLPEATEAELADAVNALLQRAHRGPPESSAAAAPSRRDRRVVARTRAATPAVPLPSPPFDGAQDEADGEDTGPIAPVIPLGVFDAHEEAKKRW